MRVSGAVTRSKGHGPHGFEDLSIDLLDKPPPIEEGSADRFLVYVDSEVDAGQQIAGDAGGDAKVVQ